MIQFFETPEKNILAVHYTKELSKEDNNKLVWLFGNANILDNSSITGNFVGPRREMITPWSTNAVEITQNMGIEGIVRIEEFYPAGTTGDFDPMLQRKYDKLTQEIFDVIKQPEPIVFIDDIATTTNKKVWH